MVNTFNVVSKYLLFRPLGRITRVTYRPQRTVQHVRRKSSLLGNPTQPWFSLITPHFHEREAIRFMSTNDEQGVGGKVGVSKDSSFVNSWISTKDRLIFMEPGTFESQNWMEAQELLKALRTNPKLSDDAVPKRVEYMFDVLDRLADEMEWIKQNCSDKKPELKTNLLNHTLDLWLDHIKVRAGTESVTNLLHAKKHRARGGQWNLGHLSVSLGTKSILSNVNRYFHVGLFKPNTIPYSIILRAMNKLDDPKYAPYEADKIYNLLIEKSKGNPNDMSFHPNGCIVNDMVEIWAQSWLPGSIDRIEDYLISLKGWYKQTNRHDQRPEPNIYCAVMEAHSRMNESRAALKRIQQLFDEMKQTCSTEELDVRTYTRVCHALVECKSQESVLAAHTILNDMCDAVTQKSNATPMPNSYMFNTLITAYGQLGNPDKAEKLFNEMKQLAYETGADSLRPTAINYSALLWAFAKVGDSLRSEVVANNIFEEMEIGNISFAELEETAVWDGVLVAWARSGHADAAVYISKWIQRLIKYGEENHVPEMVTTSTLNKLLECYSLMGTIEGAQSTEALIKWMKNQDTAALKPNGDSYYCQILAWCKAGKPDQAEIALRSFCTRVREQSLDVSAIDHRYFNIVIDAWSLSQDSRQAEKAMGVFNLMESLNIKPNAVNYNTLILALSRTKLSDKCEIVLNLFEKMKKQARDGDEFAKPTKRTYNAVIWSLGWSSESIKLEQAEELLRKCEQDEVQRDCLMYNALMSGWMRHVRPDKVEALFQEMKDGYNSGNEALKPTAATHIVRLQSWSKAGNPEKTSEALNDWIASAEAEPFHDMPDTRDFSAVLTAWLRSNRSDAAEKADRGLQQMMDLASTGRFQCFPDRHSFTAVISAYAKSKSKEAGKRALRLLEELKSLFREKNDRALDPNLLLYVEVLVACLSSMQTQDGEEAIRNLFRELLSKEASFWQEADMDVVPRWLRRLRRAFKSSRFKYDELLELDLERIESIAKNAKRRQVRR